MREDLEKELDGLDLPAGGRSGRDRYYSTRLRQLARLELEESEARDLWRKVAQHRRYLFRVLRRDVGQRVSLLDYIVNIRPQLHEPQIIEKTALEAIEHRAIADILTGLYNRNHLDLTLAQELERCRNEGKQSSVILLDLDHFKSINDTHGHIVGDHVLQRVGAIVLHHVRTTSVACRYGGDEFAVVLPDTPVEEALVVAERIRESVGAAFERDAVCGRMVDVSCSAGVAPILPDSPSVQEVIEAADRALYAAKVSGGDRADRPITYQRSLARAD